MDHRNNYRSLGAMPYACVSMLIDLLVLFVVDRSAIKTSPQNQALGHAPIDWRITSRAACSRKREAWHPQTPNHTRIEWHPNLIQTKPT